MNCKPAIHLPLLAAAVLLAQPGFAHHGFGLFQLDKDIEFEGTLTEMELVNPHSYMHIDTVGADGKPFEINCEMRAATLIKRSGWSVDMFKAGTHVAIKGHPHRDDPHACYIESFTLDNTITLDRNQQLSSTTTVDTANRAARLPTGEPNISGDWAVEQAVLTIPPAGGHGDMVPRSLVDEYASGAITLQQIRSFNPGARPLYTNAGKSSASAFRMWSVEDNPRLSCKPTSIVYDWTFDWPINRIVQTTTPAGESVIDMDYGLYSFNRRIHLNGTHPDSLTPSNTGHSIGHWEGDTLIVDTVGFAVGVLAPPTRNSDQLHIVERYTLNPSTLALHREFTAEDPVYLAAPYSGADTVRLSDVPFEKHPCEENTPEFQPPTP
jgi:Family of unknown function (DUF6152)